MADYEVLGLFNEVDAAADAVEALRLAGVSERSIKAMSAFPIASKILGRKHPRHQIVLTALAGAVVGCGAALALGIITPLLYPITVGGRPLINAPPLLILIFEMTMLGIMLGAFLGYLWQSGFPSVGGLYDKRISAGYIGVSVVVDPALLEKVEDAYNQSGVVDLQRAAVMPVFNPKWLILIAVAVVVILANVGILAVSYDFIHLSFLPDQMKAQISFAPQMGPRLPAPEGVVPVQGPALIDGQPATARPEASDASLQRGEVLYGLHCTACHGPADAESVETTVSAYFEEGGIDIPAMTGARMAARSSEQIFVFITEGIGAMPALDQNLDPAQRWDVVNYVKSLAE